MTLAQAAAKDTRRFDPVYRAAAEEAERQAAEQALARKQMAKVRASDADSQRLGVNMTRGDKERGIPPRPKPTDGAKYDASHLLPGEDFVGRPKDSEIIKRARKIYNDSGMHIDDPRNGFWGKKSTRWNEYDQMGTHTSPYFKALAQEMEQAARDGGKEADVVAALERLRIRVEVKKEFLLKP
jgi:hypothetical protein